LARARTLLELSRAELTGEQFALLSRRLAAAEGAYVEFTTAARMGRAAAAATEAGAAASANATSTGGRALLGGAAELLPLLLLVWPATAHAPGLRQETPELLAARRKVEANLKELAEAARQVESERAAAATRTTKQPSASAQGRPEAATSAGRKRERDNCWCVCVNLGEMQGGQNVKNQADCQSYCDASPWGGKGVCK
jgi:hypothetical protein